MKVLHVIWDLGQGGAQTYLRDLVKACLGVDKLSLAVLVLTNRGALSDEMETFRVPVYYVNIRNGRDINGFMQLFDFLRKSKYDIIHSHSSNILFNSMLWISSAHKVFTEHGGGLMGGASKYRLFYKIFHGNYSRFIAISKSISSDMKAANSKVVEKIRLIYNGMALDSIGTIKSHDGGGLPKEITQAKYRVGIVGRLVPQKGISIFLEAAAFLGEIQADMVFIVVGDGPQKKELLRKAERLHIKERVFFLGYRNDAKSILKLFDVFLLTSEWEPFGLVIIEAMALGVPVVAMNTKGAADEIIRDGVDGFLVDKKEPKRLGECVLKLLDNQNLREEMTISAYRRVEERFTIEQNARRVISVYEECLSG